MSFFTLSDKAKKKKKEKNSRGRKGEGGRKRRRRSRKKSRDKAVGQSLDLSNCERIKTRRRASKASRLFKRGHLRIYRTDQHRPTDQFGVTDC